jgi:protein SDA1
MMNFATRLVGNHELVLLSLYPFLQKYMGGHQRDVTAVLAYSVQACHESVPPDEVYAILKTIAHNFITERCSEEQMAVGINAVRAIFGRVPAALSLEESKESSGTTAFDVEAFTRDIAAYSNHRDRSVSIAGKGFTNFIRETYPTLLQGKDRGLKGTALHRAKAKPMRYGERKVSSGVEEEEEEVDMKSDEDEEAPDLVRVDKADATKEGEGEEEVLDLSKLTPEERDKLKQDVSSTRIFSTADFLKMRKLVERENRAKRDPREAARRKRAIARGQEFEELSGEDSDGDSEEDDEIHIKGAVNPGDIMGAASKKRKSKFEKLTKVLAGREKFENKQRAGGSTNTEKKRKKNFLMSKSSKGARTKGRGKGGLSEQRGKPQFGHEAKKRRRKT